MKMAESRDFLLAHRPSDSQLYILLGKLDNGRGFYSSSVHGSIGFLGLPYQSTTNWGLKTTETYSLMILGARSLKSRCWQVYDVSECAREDPSWLFPAPTGGWQSLACRPVTLNLSLSSLGLSVNVCAYISSYEDTYGFRTHSNAIWPHLHLVTYVKTFIPNKVTFTGTGG